MNGLNSMSKIGNYLRIASCSSIQGLNTIIMFGSGIKHDPDCSLFFGFSGLLC
jgi:hypothetical protein